MPSTSPALVRCSSVVSPAAAGSASEAFCQAEVEELCLTAVGDEDVSWLDVAVDDTFGVRGIERVGNLQRQIDEAIVRQRFAADRLVERCTFQQLHDDEVLAGVFADVVDRADVRVIQS